MKYRVLETTIQTITNVYYVEASSAEEAEEIYDMVSAPDEDESYVGGCRVEDISVEEI